MRTLLFRAVGLVALPLCFAQVVSAESPYRIEVFGSLGGAEGINWFGGPNPQDLNIGGGVGARPFSVDRTRLLRMLGVEFEVNTTQTSGGSVKYFTGNLLLHASVGPVEPYLLVGGGAARAGSTHRAVDGGFGAKVFINPRVSVRPELRLMIAEYVGDFVRGSIGVGYHW